MKISTLYDDLYEEADFIIKRNNPCQIKDGKCFAGQPCCTNCAHLKNNGCTVKSLACKLWLCYKLREHLKTKGKAHMVGMLDGIHAIAVKLDFNVFRGTKNENLRCHKMVSDHLKSLGIE